MKAYIIAAILGSMFLQSCGSRNDVSVFRPARDNRYNLAFREIFRHRGVLRYFENYEVDPRNNGVIVSERLQCGDIGMSYWAEEIVEQFSTSLIGNDTSLFSLRNSLQRFDVGCQDSFSPEIGRMSRSRTGQLLIEFSRMREGIVPGITIMTAHITSTSPDVDDPTEDDPSRYDRGSLRLIFFFDKDSNLVGTHIRWWVE